MTSRRAAVWSTPALALAGLAAAGCGSRKQPADTARNVIFLHGDGMGASARDLIRLATEGRDDDLVMNRLRYSGLVETDPADPREAVTDSAAGATAYATGARTHNGGIGVDEEGGRCGRCSSGRARRAGRPGWSPRRR
jgi:alkaline phosphatase